MPGIFGAAPVHVANLTNSQIAELTLQAAREQAAAAWVQAVGAIMAIITSVALAVQSGRRESAANAASAEREMQANLAAERRADEAEQKAEQRIAADNFARRVAEVERYNAVIDNAHLLASAIADRASQVAAQWAQAALVSGASGYSGNTPFPLEAEAQRTSLAALLPSAIDDASLSVLMSAVLEHSGNTKFQVPHAGAASAGLMASVTADHAERLTQLARQIQMRRLPTPEGP